MKVLGCDGDLDPVAETCSTGFYTYTLTSDVLPAPAEIAEAWGAGFIIALPVLITIFGGRMILKSFFLR